MLSVAGFVILSRKKIHSDGSPLWTITPTDLVSSFAVYSFVKSTSSWSFYFAGLLEHLEYIRCNLLKKKLFFENTRKFSIKI